jgi:regulator of Ty1 transposition protein 109
MASTPSANNDSSDIIETTKSGQKTISLHDKLASVLPLDFKCKIRYIRTRAQDCDPLFPSSPGDEPETTSLTSHFLTVSVDSKTVPFDPAKFKPTGSKDVLSFAIEVFVYNTKHLTTIFVSKIDSTSYISRHRPSPIQRTVTTFLEWLKDSQLQRHPKRKIVISLFARAQAQYIFPGSSDDRGDAKYNKHVLDDRQLTKWWVRTVDPIIPHDKSSGTSYQGHLTVPGYEGNELKRSFTPPSRDPKSPNWLPGHPLLELAKARGLPEHAPPRCLLPRFPDDPKARYILELDEEVGLSQESQSSTTSPSKRKGRWTSVRDLKSFWDAMEFRQECSSGRVVGFLWLVITPPGHVDPEDDEDDWCLIAHNGQKIEIRQSQLARLEQKQQQSQKQKPKKRKPLTGPINPRPPRPKGGLYPYEPLKDPSNKKPVYATVHPPSLLSRGIIVSKQGYEKSTSTLLNLDFSNIEIGIASTKKWISEIASICGLRRDADFAVEVVGKAGPEDEIRGQTAGAGAGTKQPYVDADDGVVRFGGEGMQGLDGGGGGLGRGGEGKVNDLSGMVVRKKKRSATNTMNQGEDGAKTARETAAEAAPEIEAGVNVLGGGMVRKKAKKTNV